MKQIKNKQELNLVSHIKESAELVLRDINSTTKLNPNLFDQGEDKMLSNLGKNCENLIKEFHLLEDKNLLSLIKNGMSCTMVAKKLSIDQQSLSRRLSITTFSIQIIVSNQSMLK